MTVACTRSLSILSRTLSRRPQPLAFSLTYPVFAPKMKTRVATTAASALLLPAEEDCKRSS